MTVWELFLAGGPFMWPILAVSVAAVQVVTERWIFFKRVEGDLGEVLRRIEGFLLKDDVGAAVAECEQSHLPGAKILRAGVLKFGSPQARVVQAMDDAAGSQVPVLERGLLFLQMAAQLATYLGLAGTVAGLCRIFFSVQARAEGMQIVGPADISGGLAQALLTTLAGLTVAIPAHFFYRYYLQRAQVMAADAQKASIYLAELLERLGEGRRASGSESQ